MVEGHVAVICVAVAALALAAAALGIIAEAAKSKSFVRFDGASCLYRRTPAFGCGVAAAASLLTGQAVLTAAAGCWGRCCRGRRPDRRRARAVFSALLMSRHLPLQIVGVDTPTARGGELRFLAVLAACTFLVGALKNQGGERRPKGEFTTYYSCTILMAGVFAGGSFLSIAAAAVGIASYVAVEEAAPPRPPGRWGGGLRQDMVAEPTDVGPRQGAARGSAKNVLLL